MLEPEPQPHPDQLGPQMLHAATRSGGVGDGLTLGLGDGFGADDGAAARLVLDHDRLAQDLFQPLAEGARAGVGGAARRIGDDDANRPVRIGLGSTGARNDHNAGGRQHGTALHYLLPNFAQGGMPCEAKAYPVRLESAGPDMPGVGMRGATRFRSNGTASGSI